MSPCRPVRVSATSLTLMSSSATEYRERAPLFRALFGCRRRVLGRRLGGFLDLLDRLLLLLDELLQRRHGRLQAVDLAIGGVDPALIVQRKLGDSLLQEVDIA